jgi:hypothetical protein
MTIERAYDENHTDFTIEVPTDEEPRPLGGIGGTWGEVEFDYSAPSITVDTGGRFATHEIVGGPVVRQRIGSEPIEVSITGVCKERIAKQLDRLRTVEYGTLYSNRLPDESLDVQFITVSTQPLSDGGAVEAKDNLAEFLYTYDIECVEVVL